MAKRLPPHPLRPPPATKVPLDDGRTEGIDPWRTVNGVAFCQWDRWLLRLALDEYTGIPAVAEELRRRSRDRKYDLRTYDALLAQVTDLTSRMRAIGTSARELLDATEQASTWLRAKARRRIWEASCITLTDAMRRTPRNVLAARARDGNWHAFTVSPKPHFAALQKHYDGMFVDYRAISVFVNTLEYDGSALLRQAADDNQRLAVLRAIVGTCIEAMACADDSGDDLGTYFRERERQYYQALLAQPLQAALLRDLLELAIWEDFGLMVGLEDFLMRLDASLRREAARQLAQIAEELRAADIGWQLQKAERLLTVVCR